MTDPAESQSPCPVCGASRFTPGRYGLTRCDGCGLIVDPSVWRPGEAEQLEHEWFGEAYDPYSSRWVRLFERWQNARTLRRLRGAGIRGGSLLEIGIGSGSFLAAAREAGFRVTGCDLSPSICRRARDRFGVDVHCGDLATIDRPGGFDVIVMNHVLEHTPAPRGLLAAVQGLLTPGGRIHVAVPNVDCWEAALPGWTSYEPYHLLYFTPRTLRQTLETCGLRVLSVATAESFSGWFLAILRSLVGRPPASRSAAAEPGRKSTLRRALEGGYRLAMVASGALIWPLRVLQARLGRGDEAVAIVAHAGSGVSGAAS